MPKLKLNIGKQKFKYNPETLGFEKIQNSVKRRIQKGFKFLITGLFFGLIIYCFFSFCVESPQVRHLKQENNVLVSQYNLINDKLSEFETVYEAIQYQDDSLYRAIYGMEPLPGTIRQAGFGGISRYKEVEGYSSSEVMLFTTKRLDVLLTQMYIQQISFSEIMDKVRSSEERMKCIPAIQPIKNRNLKRIASGFGLRIHPILRIRRMHTGMDFTASSGTNVFATGNGKVIKVKKSRRGFGNIVMIDHGFGFISVYAHLKSINVVVGDDVERGDNIATVGSSGFSTGPHLHYEVHYNDKAVDPVNFYFNDLTPNQYNEVLALTKRDLVSFD